MRAINPYLMFDGNCREAMTFYQRCLGGQLDVMTFADAPMEAAPGTENRVMHAALIHGPVMLMASDTMGDGKEPNVEGNNVWVNLAFDTVDELEKAYAAMAEGGHRVMEPADAFWGSRFGMLRDRFGMHWMFNCEIQQTS